MLCKNLFVYYQNWPCVFQCGTCKRLLCLMGVPQMQAVSGGNGNCCCKMIVKKQHENRNGLLHGGMVATLVDVVSTAGLMTSDWAAPGVSIELSVS